jgi:phage baseplate assembly protein W
VFEPLDDIVIGKIEEEINDAVEKYIPNLKINKITIETFYDNIQYINDQKQQHTIKIKIDYVITSRTFQSPDTVTLVL